MDLLDSINSETTKQINISNNNNLFQFPISKNEHLNSAKFMEFKEQKKEKINEISENLNFEDNINLRQENEQNGLENEELNGIEENVYNNNYILQQNFQELDNQQQKQSSRPSSSFCWTKEECSTTTTNTLDSGDELPPNEELLGAPVHEIRCGLLIGKLHMIRFTCPGIHRKCVEFEGKLISPRQFTIKAEKDKQKDWKGSIRLGKHNLRTLMEMKTLDFYEHEINCSLKCQSRNYIKNRKAEGNGIINNNEMIITNNDNNNNGDEFNEMFEINDIKSVPSSSVCSSATSTRKSSTVLEEFACQTVPPIYSSDNHQNQQNFDYLNEIKEEELENTSKSLLFSSPSTILPSTSSLVFSSPNIPSSCELINSSSSTLLLNNNKIIKREGERGESSFSSSSSHHFNNNNNNSAISTLNTLLQLQQQNNNNNSPLKQLLLLPKNNEIILNSNGGNNLEGINNNNNNKTNTNLSLLENNNDISQETALALLLQSVQTSIILEQKQKLQTNQQQNNNNNNHQLLTQLLSSLNNNTNGGILQQQQLYSSPSLFCNNNTTNNKKILNGNGIEKLLAAASLFPQLQQNNNQRTTPLKYNNNEQSSTNNNNITNIRKNMEENSSMFWSQMRNMGLLDDMLKTLSDTLERLKQIYLTGGNVVSEQFAAKRLSGVALALDLCSLFGEKIHSRYIQATLESTLISKELLELQRKQDEQKRKLENAKRKSQVFDQILKNGETTTTLICNNSLNGTNHYSSSSSTKNENGTPEIKKIHLNI